MFQFIQGQLLADTTGDTAICLQNFTPRVKAGGSRHNWEIPHGVLLLAALEYGYNSATSTAHVCKSHYRL